LSYNPTVAGFRYRQNKWSGVHRLRARHLRWPQNTNCRAADNPTGGMKMVAFYPPPATKSDGNLKIVASGKLSEAVISLGSVRNFWSTRSANFHGLRQM